MILDRFQPTPHVMVQDIITLSNLNSNSILIDLGCGDGRILNAAVRAGATAIGYEIDVELCEKIQTILLPGASAVCADFFDVDISNGTVIVAMFSQEHLPAITQLVGTIPCIVPDYDKGVKWLNQ